MTMTSGKVCGDGENDEERDPVTREPTMGERGMNRFGERK